MLIRYATLTDLPQIVQLFFSTIHIVNRQHYTEEQVNAWAPKVPDEARWAAAFETHTTLVAEADGLILGFTDFEPDGHIDHFFCHHAHQGKGVGKALLQRLEEEVRSRNITRLFVEVSITARPFFEHMGYRFLHENQVVRNNVILTNFSMEKMLEAE